jgi:hypothetical protein
MTVGSYNLKLKLFYLAWSGGGRAVPEEEQNENQTQHGSEREDNEIQRVDRSLQHHLLRDQITVQLEHAKGPSSVSSAQRPAHAHHKLASNTL